MDIKRIKKFANIVNTIILGLVFGLMFFFVLCEVPFLVYYSIPTAIVYVVGYFLIHKEKFAVYVWMVYIWLTLYMGITTVCLGYGYGFHLYCFSMIPVMFVTEYISYKLKRRSLKAISVSIFVALFYLICTGYTSYYGPLFVRDQKFAAFFWIFNAIIVFSFLIYYTNYLIRSVITSEEKLTEMALVDRLTQLHNRHYMINCLEALSVESENFLIAMADIDNFKKINDTFGHNAGDEVLKAVSQIMKNECEGCEVSRWGGEEFLILSSSAPPDGKDMLERVRSKVEAEPVKFEDKIINVTVTIGMAYRQSGQSVDSWIQAADDKLYVGKNNGKNQVIV